MFRQGETTHGSRDTENTHLSPTKDIPLLDSPSKRTRSALKNTPIRSALASSNQQLTASPRSALQKKRPKSGRVSFAASAHVSIIQKDVIGRPPSKSALKSPAPKESPHPFKRPNLSSAPFSGAEELDEMDDAMSMGNDSSLQESSAENQSYDISITGSHQEASFSVDNMLEHDHGMGAQPIPSSLLYQQEHFGDSPVQKGRNNNLPSSVASSMHASPQVRSDIKASAPTSPFVLSSPRVSRSQMPSASNSALKSRLVNSSTASNLASPCPALPPLKSQSPVGNRRRSVLPSPSPQPKALSTNSPSLAKSASRKLVSLGSPKASALSSRRDSVAPFFVGGKVAVTSKPSKPAPRRDSVATFFKRDEPAYMDTSNVQEKVEDQADRRDSSAKFFAKPPAVSRRKSLAQILPLAEAEDDEGVEEAAHVAAMKEKINGRRDSVAVFFNKPAGGANSKDTGADIEDEEREDLQIAAVKEQIQNSGRRDSIAVFFNKPAGSSVIKEEAQIDYEEEAQVTAAKEKIRHNGRRDSVAVFFKPNSAAVRYRAPSPVNKAMNNPRDSMAGFFPSRDQVKVALKSAPRNRDSIAGFFSHSGSSALSSPVAVPLSPVIESGVQSADVSMMSVDDETYSTHLLADVANATRPINDVASLSSIYHSAPPSAAGNTSFDDEQEDLTVSSGSSRSDAEFDTVTIARRIFDVPTGGLSSLEDDNADESYDMGADLHEESLVIAPCTPLKPVTALTVSLTKSPATVVVPKSAKKSGQTPLLVAVLKRNAMSTPSKSHSSSSQTTSSSQESQDAGSQPIVRSSSFDSMSTEVIDVLGDLPSSPFVASQESDVAPIMSATDSTSNSQSFSANEADTKQANESLQFDDSFKLDLPNLGSPVREYSFQNSLLDDMLASPCTLASSPDHIGVGHANLMDEELAMVEGEDYAMISSPVRHLSSPSQATTANVITLNDFLDATGIHFMDGLTTTIRRETSAFLKNATAPTVPEYVYAQAVVVPEVEVYEFGCKELAKNIQVGREQLAQREADVAAEPPLLFYEFDEGTVEEQTEILQHLRETKTLAKLEAKEAWYDWRLKLLIPQNDSFKETLSHFERDLRYIKNFSTNLNGVIADVKSSRDSIKAAILQTMELRHETESVDKQMLEEQIKVREGQAKLIRKLEEELAAAKLALAEEDPKMERLLAEKTSTLAAIEHSKSVCKDLMIFDPEELGNLRHEYRLLLLTHLWSPLHATERSVSFVYDSAIAVHSEVLPYGGGFKTYTSIANSDEKLTRYSLETTQSKRLLDFFGKEKINSLLRCLEVRVGMTSKQSNLKQMANAVAALWDNIKLIHLDIEKARQVCFIEPYTANEPSDSTFAPSIFGLDPLAIQTVLSWKIDVHYGGLCEKDIESCLVKGAAAQKQAFPHGYLANLLVLLKTLL